METDKLLPKKEEVSEAVAVTKDVEDPVKVEAVATDVAEKVEQPSLPVGSESEAYQDVVEEIPASKWREMTKAFGSLGLVAFGGPVAHVALLHQQFVQVKGPLSVSEDVFLELFSMVQALPGPSSTQLVTALGIVQAGRLGGLLAFALFQLPGFLAMTIFGLLMGLGGEGNSFLQAISLFTHGLIAAAFAQVTIAAATISNRVCQRDKLKAAICILSTAAAVVCVPSSVKYMYPLILGFGGLLTYVRDTMSGVDVRPAEAPTSHSVNFARDISKDTGYTLLMIVAGITAFLLLIVGIFGDSLPLIFLVFDAFWRMGAFVFGGGQVVLPMIMNEVVNRGWLSLEVFLNGFAVVQVMPGPMFNLSPFVGAAVAGIIGAAVAALGLFGPGIMLVFAVLPFWAELRKTKLVTACLPGVTAAASGLINSAVYFFLMKSLSSKLSFAIAAATAGLTLFFDYKAPITIVAGGLLGTAGIAMNIGGPFCSVAWWTSRVSAEHLAAVC